MRHSILVFCSLKGRHKALVTHHSETANAVLTQLCGFTRGGDEHRVGLIHCEQTTPIPFPKKGFLSTPVDYFKKRLGLFERHLTEWLFSGCWIKMQWGLGWTVAPVHSRHEEIHPCVAAGRRSALHSSSTGNFMTSLHVYHRKSLLLKWFKSLA